MLYCDRPKKYVFKGFKTSFTPYLEEKGQKFEMLMKIWRFSLMASILCQISCFLVFPSSIFVCMIIDSKCNRHLAHVYQRRAKNGAETGP